MSNLSEAMSEMADSKSAETEPQASTVETPVEEPSAEQSAEQSTEQSSETDAKPAAEPKPDLSKLSKQEKAEHAFRRQLAKQKAKNDADLKSRDDAIDSLKKEIEALKKERQTPEEVKTRKDFGTDDEYISYLAGRQVDSILADRDAQASKKAEEEAAKAREQEAARSAAEEETRNFRANIEAAIPEEERAQFHKTLARSVENGLGEVLDSSPMVRDYIFKHSDGPLLLKQILSDKDSFVRVFSQREPMYALLEARDIVAKAKSAPVEEQAPAPVSKMPHLGKPGAGGASTGAPNVFSDDRALINFIRKPRVR